MQQLRDKLAIAERAARSEALLKVILVFHLWLLLLRGVFRQGLKSHLPHFSGEISVEAQSNRGEFEGIFRQQ